MFRFLNPIAAFEEAERQHNMLTNEDVCDLQHMRDAKQFLIDARAFLRFGYDNGLDEKMMLATLIHDIAGLANRERCFLPRVSGYAQQEAEGRLKTTTGTKGK
jgi:hypothetical protein